MEFSEIAAVTGKSGLYKVLKPSRTGFILESLDEEKNRLVTSPNTKVSLLSEVSIYTTNQDGSVPLQDVMKKIYSEYGTDTGVEAQSDNSELRSFMKSVLPEHDEERVYISDIKKLLKWYQVLSDQAPETLKESESGKEATEKKGD